MAQQVDLMQYFSGQPVGEKVVNLPKYKDSKPARKEFSYDYGETLDGARKHLAAA
ncbi:hypothetical protein [Paenibacillus jiagnxiensis]|uniref:hypothetical protein n=1 Tax=Paenibacillus jiagnxiensis TaxID=3228926 RepID=UPI0033A0AA8B